jgi:hypothetical protein
MIKKCSDFRLRRVNISLLAGIFSLLILVDAWVLAGTQAILYVAPAGSVTNWSPAQPGNLTAVPARIRTMNLNITGDIIVYLYGGSYKLNSSFQCGRIQRITIPGLVGTMLPYSRWAITFSTALWLLAILSWA